MAKVYSAPKVQTRQLELGAFGCFGSYGSKPGKKPGGWFWFFPWW